MKTEEVQHLASLARIALTDDEATALAGEFDTILEYVAQVTNISAEGEATPATGVLANVMREDMETHAPGEYTEALLSAAPERAGQFVQVKKILENNDSAS